MGVKHISTNVEIEFDGLDKAHVRTENNHVLFDFIQLRLLFENYTMGEIEEMRDLIFARAKEIGVIKYVEK